MRLGKRGSDWCNLLQQRRTIQHSAAPYPVIQYSGRRKTGNFPVSVFTACKLRSADMSAASHWPAWRLIRNAGAILCPRSLLLSFAGDTSTDRLNRGAGAPGSTPPVRPVHRNLASGTHHRARRTPASIHRGHTSRVHRRERNLMRDRRGHTTGPAARDRRGHRGHTNTARIGCYSTLTDLRSLVDTVQMIPIVLKWKTPD